MDKMLIINILTISFLSYPVFTDSESHKSITILSHSSNSLVRPLIFLPVKNYESRAFLHTVSFKIIKDPLSGFFGNYFYSNFLSLVLSSNDSSKTNARLEIGPFRSRLHEIPLSEPNELGLKFDPNLSDSEYFEEVLRTILEVQQEDDPYKKVINLSQRHLIEELEYHQNSHYSAVINNFDLDSLINSKKTSHSFILSFPLNLSFKHAISVVIKIDFIKNDSTDFEIKKIEIENIKPLKAEIEEDFVFSWGEWDMKDLKKDIREKEPIKKIFGFGDVKKTIESKNKEYGDVLRVDFDFREEAV